MNADELRKLYDASRLMREAHDSLEAELIKEKHAGARIKLAIELGGLAASMKALESVL